MAPIGTTKKTDARKSPPSRRQNHAPSGCIPSRRALLAGSSHSSSRSRQPRGAIRTRRLRVCMSSKWNASAVASACGRASASPKTWGFPCPSIGTGRRSSRIRASARGPRSTPETAVRAPCGSAQCRPRAQCPIGCRTRRRRRFKGEMSADSNHCIGRRQGHG